MPMHWATWGRAVHLGLELRADVTINRRDNTQCGRLIISGGRLLTPGVWVVSLRRATAVSHPSVNQHGGPRPATITIAASPPAITVGVPRGFFPCAPGSGSTVYSLQNNIGGHT